MAFIPHRRRMPLLIRIVVAIAERVVGKRLEPARLLSWYPKAAISSGLLESLVAHDERGVPSRLLGLIRIRTSYAAQCPFCVDMNAAGARDVAHGGVSDDEARALRTAEAIERCASFSERERIALRWVDCLTATPIRIPTEALEAMQRTFSPREHTIITVTVAQVNYWTRLIQGFGIAPAGFSSKPELLELDHIGRRD